jgi:hypothetical protein
MHVFGAFCQQGSGCFAPAHELVLPVHSIGVGWWCAGWVRGLGCQLAVRF